MTNLVIIDGDAIRFSPAFGKRTVMVPENSCIKGTGLATISNKRFCIIGDEKRVSIHAFYTTPDFPIAGTGRITISSLGPDQRSAFTCGAGKVILKGSHFIARFRPQSPAVNANNIPDPEMAEPTSGIGQFIPQQSYVTVQIGQYQL